MYCGFNEYISTNAYRKAVNSSMTEAKLKSKDKGYSMFVKDVAEAIIGREVLKDRSVSGRKCNAVKNSVAKPKLDDNKILAVKGIFKYYLVQERGLDRVAAEQEVGSVHAYIASKISDLNKKSEAKTEDNKNDEKNEKNKAKNNKRRSQKKDESESDESSESDDDDNDDENKTDEDGDDDQSESDSNTNEDPGSSDSD